MEKKTRISDIRIKAISVMLALVLFAEALPYVKAIKERAPLSGVLSSSIAANNTESNRVLRALKKNSDSDLSEREKALYEACNTYRSAASDKGDSAKVIMACTYVVTVAEYYHDEDEEIRSAFSALVAGKSVCHGYARAVQLLLKSVDIDSRIVLGSVDSDTIDHAWLIVSVDTNNDGVKENYHCDPLWCEEDNEGDLPTLSYCLMSDEEAKERRTWAYDEYPKCEWSVDFNDTAWRLTEEMKERILSAE